MPTLGMEFGRRVARPHAVESCELPPDQVLVEPNIRPSEATKGAAAASEGSGLRKASAKHPPSYFGVVLDSLSTFLGNAILLLPVSLRCLSSNI